MSASSLAAGGAAATEPRSQAGRLLWAAYAVTAVLLAAYIVVVLVRPNGTYWTWLDGWAVSAFEILLSGMCLARGLKRQPGSTIALFFGLGIMSWSVGDLVLTIESLRGATPPTPSLADAFYLCFYPLSYVAIVLLMRKEIKRISPPSLLDGGVAGLGAATLCAAFAFHSIAATAGGHPLGVATNLAYPIGDMLLLALVVGGTTLLSGRGRLPWAMIAVGISFNVAGDTFNLFGSTAGASRIGSSLNAIAWPIAILLISMAVWVRPRIQLRGLTQPTTGFALPGLASAVSLVVLFVASLHHLSRVAVVLAAGTLAAAGVRLMISTRGLKTLTEERHRQSVTDELTGLGNRRYLSNVFEQIFEQPEILPGIRPALAFLFLDLDHFKEINDSFGHPVGDELLRQLGPRLTAAVRSTDFVVRLGGDEFAVVLVNARAEDATKVAERITAGIEEPFVLNMVTARIGASIGIAILDTDANDAAGLFRCADIAMFRAKTANAAFAFYDQDLDNENVALMAEELRAAVDQEQFVLYYQPQLDLRTGDICAFEALIRWDNPRLGMVAPLKFLPLAEEMGLMPSLTAWVLDRALSRCAMWRADGRDVAVSVNLSTSNLLDPGFTDLVQHLLARHGVPFSSLVLEITETCIISDYERSKKIIEDLRGLGLVVSIDDFGAGFTSLAYLGDLAVGELKLDRIFVSGIGPEDRPRDLPLIRSTIELAHALRLRVVAEGIEDRGTLELLIELGCDLAQGYFIGMPMPDDRLEFGGLKASGDAALVG